MVADRRGDDLAHRMPVTAAQIDCSQTRRVGPQQRRVVSLGEILHVDVVPDTGPVGGRVVVAEDGECQLRIEQ